MPGDKANDTQRLLAKLLAGDSSASDLLLDRYRQKLKQLISIRMDRRVKRRVDPSDVVQETLIQAAKRLADYARNQQLPFYPWIRQIAIEQVVVQHRRHLKALRRSVNRELDFSEHLPEHAELELSEVLMAKQHDSMDSVERKELIAVVRQVLAELGAKDRDVLALRFLEQLTIPETAEVLGQKPEAVKSQQRRAIERFTRLFNQYKPG